MAQSLNRVQLIGRAGRDPEARSLGNGTRVANFSLATSETWTDKRTGEKREKTEWHNVSVFGDGTVRFLEQYVSKGDLLLVEGKLQTREWTDKEGVERKTTEIVVQGFGGQVIKLAEKGSGGRDRSDDRERYPETRSSSGRQSGNGSRSFDLDDDIPF